MHLEIYVDRSRPLVSSALAPLALDFFNYLRLTRDGRDLCAIQGTRLSILVPLQNLVTMPVRHAHDLK